MHRKARDAAKRNETDSTLTPAQDKAVVSLVSGATPSEAAEQVGVARSTLYRWMADPEFAAALNRIRRDLSSSQRLRLSALGTEAVACIERAVENGDVKTALQVAGSLGLLTPTTIGPDDPNELRLQAEAAARERETRAAEAELEHARRLESVEDGHHTIGVLRMLRP